MIDIVFTKRNERGENVFSRCKELKDALNHICENCRPILIITMLFSRTRSWRNGSE